VIVNKISNNNTVLALTIMIVFFCIFSFSNYVFGITVNVGISPSQVVVNQNTHLVYVANTGSNTVSVIDGLPSSPTNNTVISTITVGSTPIGIDLDKTNNIIYTANQGSNTVSVINGSTNSVITNIPVGIAPSGVSVNPNTKLVYVANTFSGTISVINGSTNTVTNTIPAATGITRIAINPNLNKIYATNFFSTTVLVINSSTNHNVANITVGSGPVAAAVNPNNNKVYVTNFNSNTVSVINGTTNTVIATIPVGNTPDGVSIDTSTNKVYVANRNSNIISVINGTTDSVVGTIPTSDGQRGIDLDQNTGRIYATGVTTNAVLIYSGLGSNPPTANAGTDKVVNAGTLVTLNGTSPTPGLVSFNWSQTAGPTVLLSNSNTPNPTFIAPQINFTTVLTFQLVVNQSSLTSVPSTVNIIVTNPNTVTVPLSSVTNAILNGNVTVAKIVANSTTTFNLLTPSSALPFAKLQQAVVPSGKSGNNVFFNFTVSSQTSQGLPPTPSSIVLFFSIDTQGINFSNPSIFPSGQSPTSKFLVSSSVNTPNHFQDGCPAVPIFLLNTTTNQWIQLGDPLIQNTNRIFVSDENSNNLSVIDGSTNGINSTISESGGATGVTYDPVMNKIYLNNGLSNTVTVMNGSTNSVISTIPVGTSPSGIDIDTKTNRVYVANSGSNSVSVIDGSTNSVIATIPVGSTPFNLAVNPNLDKVYVGNFFSNTISVIDGTTNSVTTTISSINSPGVVAVDPKTNKVYVGNFFTGSVSVINASNNTPISSIKVGQSPRGISVNQNNVYVSNSNSNSVSVIDTNADIVIATIPVGTSPGGITINPNTDRIYVANSGSNSVSVIDGLANNVISTILVGNGPNHISINSNVPNPARDPSTDVKDGFGKITQCSYVGNLPHLSKFAVGGIIPALAILGAGGGGEPGPSLGFSTLLFSTLPDAIKNSILHHDPFKPIAPSTDPSISYPLSIDGKGYLLGGYSNTIQTVTEKTGAPVDLHMISQDGSPIQHVALYANLQGSSKDLYDSDTYIIYDEGKPLQIVDPHGFFSNVKFNIKDEGLQHELTYTITFAKPMAKSDLDLRMWDESKHSSDTKIYDALQVVTDASQANNDQASNNNSILTDAKSTTTQNSDTMIAIKDWGGYSSHPISDSEFLSDVGIKGHEIPHWAMKTTKWILDGEISPQDFANTLKYMEEKGILK